MLRTIVGLFAGVGMTMLWKKFWKLMSKCSNYTICHKALFSKIDIGGTTVRYCVLPLTADFGGAACDLHCRVERALEQAKRELEDGRWVTLVDGPMVITLNKHTSEDRTNSVIKGTVAYEGSNIAFYLPYDISEYFYERVRNLTRCEMKLPMTEEELDAWEHR